MLQNQNSLVAQVDQQCSTAKIFSHIGIRIYQRLRKSHPDDKVNTKTLAIIFRNVRPDACHLPRYDLIRTKTAALLFFGGDYYKRMSPINDGRTFFHTIDSFRSNWSLPMICFITSMAPPEMRLKRQSMKERKMGFCSNS